MTHPSTSVCLGRRLEVGNHERLPWTQCPTERDGCLPRLVTLFDHFRNLQNGEDHELWADYHQGGLCEVFVRTVCFTAAGRGNATTSDPPNLHDGRFRGAALPDDVGDEEQQQLPTAAGSSLGLASSTWPWTSFDSSRNPASRSSRVILGVSHIRASFVMRWRAADTDGQRQRVNSRAATRGCRLSTNCLLLEEAKLGKGEGDATEHQEHAAEQPETDPWPAPFNGSVVSCLA